MPRSRDDVVAHQRLKIESLLNLDLLGRGPLPYLELGRRSAPTE